MVVGGRVGIEPTQRKIGEGWDPTSKKVVTTMAMGYKATGGRNPPIIIQGGNKLGWVQPTGSKIKLAKRNNVNPNCWGRWGLRR